MQGGGWGGNLLASYIGPHLPLLSLSILDSPFSRCVLLNKASFFFSLLFILQGCWLELSAANGPSTASQASAQTLWPLVPLSPRVPGRGDGLAMSACTLGTSHPCPRPCCLPSLTSARCFAGHKSWPAGGFSFTCASQTAEYIPFSLFFFKFLMVCNAGRPPSPSSCVALH